MIDRICSRMAMKSGSDFTARAFAGLEEAVAEVELVFVGDAARARRHDDQPRRPMNRASSTLWVMKNTILWVLAPDVEDEFLHGLAGQCIQGAERLVHQERVRIGGQRTGEADALLHAARQLVDVAGLEVLQAHQLEVFAGDLAPLGLADPLQLEAEGDVLQNGQPGHQRVFLEHHAAVGSRAVDPLAAEGDGAVGRLDEAGRAD